MFRGNSQRLGPHQSQEPVLCGISDGAPCWHRLHPHQWYVCLSGRWKRILHEINFSVVSPGVDRSDYTSNTAGTVTLQLFSDESGSRSLRVFFFSIFYLQDSQCVDKLYANLPGASVPLNVYSPWGGVNCHVKLTSVPGSLIRLTVTSFVIEPTDCVNDALTVYDALLPMRGRILHRWDCSWQEMHSILDYYEQTSHVTKHQVIKAV